MQETLNKIEQWAVDRNFLEGSTPQAQLLKLTEELGEVIETFTKNRPEETAGEIGDMVVVLTIICAQTGLDLAACVDMAYKKIKDRKGKMINGSFIKEEDLD